MFHCKDCDKRHPGCHAECETYKQDKAAWDEKREAQLKERHIAGRLYQQRQMAVSKAMKNRHPGRRGIHEQ